MTNKSTKRALLASLLALVVSISMLVGTTFAWFTDSVTSGRNLIQSGNLDVELEYFNGNAWVSVQDATDIFSDELWEPGHTEVVYLKVSNKGSLALKYQLGINIWTETAGVNVYDEAFKLSDYILFDAIDIDGEADFFATREDALKATDDVDFISTGFTKGSSLEKNGEEYLALVVYMPTEVGNEANYKPGTTAPSIELGINLVATQYTYESDSYDDQYDAGAEYPEFADEWDGTADFALFGLPRNASAEEIANVELNDDVYIITTSEELAAFAKLVDAGNTFEGKTVKLGTDLDLASLPFNPIGHSSNGKSFNGTFDGQGHTISNMYEQSDLSAWQYEGEYYGLFAYTNGATIKNVTIADAYISSGRNEAAGVVGNAVNTTFSDITISNTTLIAYNNSAGGVAAECYGNCSFTNITVDEDTVIGPLWGTYDVRLGGVVGLVHAGNNVTFSNITVACQLDAINDVAANYQYWLYRYSGMLIGHVDGVDGVADPTGYVTCENVKVIYGDWVNYHYCEDAGLGAGSYNGPGEYKYARVEAGTGTDGIDLSACNHNDDESHNVLIVFDQLFGGGQGVSGLKTYDGVTVVYPNN